jgi:hypothetical protein
MTKELTKTSGSGKILSYVGCLVRHGFSRHDFLEVVLRLTLYHLVSCPVLSPAVRSIEGVLLFTGSFMSAIRIFFARAWLRSGLNQ